MIKSHRAGVGKTLKVQRITSEVTERTTCVTIPLQRKCVDVDAIMESLLKHQKPPTNTEKRVFHLDLAHYVC